MVWLTLEVVLLNSCHTQLRTTTMNLLKMVTVHAMVQYEHHHCVCKVVVRIYYLIYLCCIDNHVVLSLSTLELS